MYAVIRQDTNGVKYLVTDGLVDKFAADVRIAYIVGNHTKPHKMDYDTLEYPAGERDRVFAEHGVRF